MRGLRPFLLFGATLLAQTGPGSSEALFQAIRNDDQPRLRAMIAQGVDVNARDRRGTTPLMSAAAFGSREAVRVLLDAKADVNAKNLAEHTALLWAVNDRDKVRMLLEKGADVNAKTKQGRTALLVAAAQQGNVETVRLLLDKGADPKTVDNFGTTPLIMAALTDDLDTVRLLLEKGVEIKASSKIADTALMGAAWNQNLPAVQLLLSKGAAVNVESDSGGEVKFGKIALRQLTPLMAAAPYGTVPLLEALITAGAKVNARDVRGMTPLMLAVASETQDADVVRLLLRKGADVNVKSTAGETALDWALKFGNPEVIRTLKDAGATTAATPAPAPAPSQPAELRQALAKSVALLQSSTTEFFKQSGCSACHHQNLTAMAVAEAKAKGIAVNESASTEHWRTVKLQAGLTQFPMMERMDGPTIDIPLFAMLGLVADRYPADEITDATAFHFAAQQRVNGSWHFGGSHRPPRPPIEEGDIGRTALGIRTLRTYGLPGRKAEFDRRVERARSWLLEAKLATTDDRVMQILGLKWSDADPKAIARFVQDLIALQRADGGWAGNRHLASDAYATGETLYALHQGGVAASHAAYRKGVQYLMRTQIKDGSWFVRSRAPKFQPYFESGFPHGHDQWISAAATAWATAALAQAVEPQRAGFDSRTPSSRSSH